MALNMFPINSNLQKIGPYFLLTSQRPVYYNLGLIGGQTKLISGQTRTNAEGSELLSVPILCYQRPVYYNLGLIGGQSKLISRQTWTNAEEIIVMGQKFEVVCYKKKIRKVANEINWEQF